MTRIYCSIYLFIHSFFSTCYPGNDSTSNAPRNRAGQVSHSVVLGTVNISDQGEGMITDISRV